MRRFLVNGVFVVFGLLLGVAALAVALRVIRPWTEQRGASFTSVDELHRAMVTAPERQAETEEDVQGGNLRAIVNPHPDEQIVYDLRPNLRTRFQRAQLSTNSCGMRGPEVLPPRPPDTYRIALLGDSFAFGWGVEDKESFGRRLEQNLSRIAGGRMRVELLNFSVPGYATGQEVALFLERGLAFDPDDILVFFVQNDFELPFFMQDRAQPGRILQLADFLRAKTAPAARPAMMDPNQALRKLAEAAEKRGTRVSITINPRKEWKQFRNRLTILKERRDIRLINMRRDFVRVITDRKIDSNALTLAHDPHPSPLRHAIYGDLLTPYFMDRIQ